MNAITTFVNSEQYKLALFNRKQKPEDDPSKSYPVMTGSLENANRKLHVSAYFATDKDTGEFSVDKNGNQYLNLIVSLDQTGENNVYGKLFRVVKQGVDGAYSGFLSESEFIEAEGEWIEIWSMQINGKRKTSGDEKYRYIACDVKAAVYKNPVSPAVNSELEDVAF